MKKFQLSALALIAGVIVFTSCNPNDTDGNPSIPDGDLTINYAVQVVPVGDVQKGLNGATVTIQAKGQTKTATVNADGLAIFENIKPGTVSGYVTANGYTSINFTAAINKTNIDVNTVDFVTSTVYVIATNSGLAGQVYGDYNNDGVSNPTDANDRQAVSMYVTYGISGNYPMGSGTGALISVSLDAATYGKDSDGTGNFTFTNIPSTINGYLTANYWMKDILDPDDNNNGLFQIFTIGATPVSLPPGETRQLGQIMAN